MRIHGFNKLTLLDYPQHLAATIFLGGCNFRCPFCHNGSLVLHPETEPSQDSTDVLTVLRKRRGILEGVCVTGGEPTLHPELPELLGQIKALGYLVKLDTNGYRPDTLQKLCDQGLVDYVAMDIKSAPDKYPEACGLPRVDMDIINTSVNFLMRGTIPYEFRTTVVKELHIPEDFSVIGKWIKGSSQYYLQPYTESTHVLNPVFTSYSKPELKSIRALLLPYIPAVRIRAV